MNLIHCCCKHTPYPTLDLSALYGSNIHVNVHGQPQDTPPIAAQVMMHGAEAILYTSPIRAPRRSVTIDLAGLPYGFIPICGLIAVMWTRSFRILVTFDRRVASNATGRCCRCSRQAPGPHAQAMLALAGLEPRYTMDNGTRDIILGLSLFP